MLPDDLRTLSEDALKTRIEAQDRAVREAWATLQALLAEATRRATRAESPLGRWLHERRERRST